MREIIIIIYHHNKPLGSRNQSQNTYWIMAALNIYYYNCIILVIIEYLTIYVGASESRTGVLGSYTK